MSRTINGLPVFGYRVEVRVIPLASQESPHPAFRPPKSDINEFRGSAGIDCIITSQALADGDRDKIGEHLADTARRAWNGLLERQPDWPWDQSIRDEGPPV